MNQRATPADPQERARPEPPATHRTSALAVDEVLAEARRRIDLYRRAPRGTNPDRADALEALVWWAEAQR